MRVLVRHPHVRVVARRLALAVPLLVAVSAVSFVLLSLTPGDATAAILGPLGTPEQARALEHELGLDLPVYAQYWQWLSGALGGDLGTSLNSGQAVSHEIGQRIGVTLSLTAGALLVSLVAGCGLGILSAVRGGLLGRAVDALALIGFALPAFWVGAQLIVLFAVELRWFPATGYVSPSESITEWLRSLVLPVVALSLYGVAAMAKQTREAMLDVLGSEHIRMGRANGIRPRSLLFRHALRNASMRVVTVLGVVAVGLLGGTVLVETVFTLPGLGSLVVTAAQQHDLPVVQGVAVVFTLMVVLVNLAVDLAYTALNPKVRIG